jgi:hypothetical protein
MPCPAFHLFLPTALSSVESIEVSTSTSRLIKIGRGTLECVDTKSLTLKVKNRWTASNATILGVATRNTGVIAAGGAGVVRFFDGIQRCIREVNLDRMITKIQVEKLWDSEYENAVDRVYLSCGTDGICCLEAGSDLEAVDDATSDHATSMSPLRALYSERYYWGNLVASNAFR